MVTSMLVLLALPIHSPFLISFALGVGIMAICGTLFVLARCRASSRRWPLIGAALGLLLGALLTGWAGYSNFTSPSSAEPVNHLTGAQNTSYGFYLSIWDMNIALLVCLLLLLIASLIVLFWQRKRHNPSK